VETQRQSQTGQMMAHYRVVRLLGTGGMGEVFLAEDTTLERSVALKVMSAELAQDPNQRKRFRTEAKSASALTHPNICVIHEVGETEDNRPFLAMEYIEGQTLDTIIAQRRLPLRDVVSIGLQAAEALEVAHGRGIVHRDIKPSNLMLDRRGHLKVLDFGLAKRVGQDELSAATTSQPQTRTGMLLGTPHYMSPEQALGRELDPRTDIFSLGVVLYELVAGQRPFLGRTVGETLNNVINQRPEALGLENPLFTPTLDGIIFKCLGKEPQNRYASASTLATDLRKLRDQVEAAAAKDRTVEPPPQTARVSPALAPKTELLQPAKRWTRHPASLAAFSAAIALLGATVVWLVWHKPAATNRLSPPNSVAVLPFDNFSGEADMEYLSDGLTEEITTALSRIPGLKVAARNSSFTFKNKPKDARAIGATLGVNALLEGSIRKVGSQLRVSAQLINVANGYHLWSENYDRSAEDIFAVQEDIARRIAERLQGIPAATVAARTPTDPEAHNLYLRARLFWNKRTEDGLNRAVELFQAAIQKDPGYAAAHAGLAATYVILPLYSLESKRAERFRLARASANRALELEPNCPEAHAVMGSLQADARDYRGAEEHFRRAIEQDHNSATAHHWFGVYLETHGKREQALAELKTAAELDPLSPIIRSTIPAWYYLGSDYDRSIAECRKVIDAFPDFPAARNVLISAQLMKGEYKEALTEIEQVRAIEPQKPLASLDMKGFALARLGQRSAAEAIIKQLEEQKQHGQSLDGAIAFIYLGLRDYDKSCDAFEKSIAENGIEDDILCDPFFQEVRNLPRVQEMLKKAGLLEEPHPDTAQRG
jgi:serine/threonine protein kinase/Flp pilus assembly protein TadD